MRGISNEAKARIIKDWIPRMFSLVSAVVIWYISISFSADGFGFVLNGKNSWMGWAIAVFGVTSLELVFNNGHHEENPTMTLLCIVAYTYGVLSNMIGLWMATGSPAFGLTQEFALSMAVAIPVGLILEIMPEPMLLIGFGVSSGGEDAFTQMANFVNRASTRNEHGTKQQNTPQRDRCPRCKSGSLRNHGDRIVCHSCGYNKLKRESESADIAWRGQ